MKVLFMGTPDFAKESLKALYENQQEIVGVVTNPDRAKGRGMKMIFSPVKEYALEKGLTIYQPEKVKGNKDWIQTIKELAPDVICVVAYGKILPEEILTIPKYGCLNVHGSLLPKYRGAAPIQWAVINGEETTGITTMYMDVGMDTGDMILTQKTTIGKEETTGELWDRLSIMGGELLIETLKQIQKHSAPRQKQPENASYAPMLTKQTASICWEEKSAEEIKNLVRGLNPIMGAYTFFEKKKYKFWKVEALGEEDLVQQFPELQEYQYKLKQMDSGTILFSDSKTGLYIKAKQGIVKVLEIQGENAKKMSVSDFLRGTPLMAGSIFEAET